MSYGLFEHIAANEDDRRAGARQALALARARAEKRFASFVGTGPDKEHKLALVAGDIQNTVRQACADVGYEDWKSVYDTVYSHIGGLQVESRRPKMCPYHREVTDIALATGDPQSGFSAMGQHAYGDHSCRGTFDGRCNFKPEMVTQTYWDQKNEQREERKRQQLEQPVQEAPQEEVADAINTDNTTDTVENADMQVSDEAIPVETGEVYEPQMAMAASRRAATVQRPIVHGGTLQPLEAIHRNAPGLLIDGQDIHTWSTKMASLPEHPPCEVTHPKPELERVAAEVLAAGHGGPLHTFLQSLQQPRTAEALKTIDVEQPVGPSPTIDKRKWTPENVGKEKIAEQAEMDGSPHPTRRQDIVEPTNYGNGPWEDDGRFEQTDAVLEKQYVADGIEEKPPGANGKPYYKWPSGDRSAVSSRQAGPMGEPCPRCGGNGKERLENCHACGGTGRVDPPTYPSLDRGTYPSYASVDPDKNPIRESILAPEEDVARAIQEFNSN